MRGERLEGQRAERGKSYSGSEPAEANSGTEVWAERRLSHRPGGWAGDKMARQWNSTDASTCSALLAVRAA